MATLLLSSCVLDWDSLRQEGGAGDSGDEVIFNPGDATLDHVETSTNDDASADGGDVADSADDSDDGGDSASDDGQADATVDAGDDASDASGGDDASDASDASTCSYTFTGTLATYDFSLEPGNQVSTAASSSASGLTAGAISRSSAITAQSGAGSINSYNWATTTTIDTTRYYTLTLTPPAGCALGLTSMSVDNKASGSGPLDGAAATSADGFTSTTTFATTSVANVSLSVSGATSAVEIRIYGYDASLSAGTWRIQNTMTVSGSLK